MLKISGQEADLLNDKLFPYKSSLFSVVKPLPPLRFI